MKIKFIILFLFCTFFSWAQDKNSLDIRIIDTLSIQKYSEQDGFDYMEKPVLENESLKTKFLRWLSRQFIDKGSFAIKPLFYIIMIISFVLLLYFFANSQFLGIFERKKSQKVLELSALHENITEIDFKHLIQQAEDTNQYRLAVRFKFNQLLKNLDKKGVITWAEYKTNFDFINEIKQLPPKEAFRDITTIYDYIWYGEQSMNESEYLQYKTQIAQLTQKIS